MASVINQSNNNSSLVATLMEARDSVVNPFVYNIDKQTKFHGVQYVEESAENAGNASAGKSIDFNVSKFGFLRSAIFKWTMTAGGTSGALNMPRSGTLNCIDRIEILSSSRRLAVLDKYSLMCAISDMPRDVQRSYHKGLHMSAIGGQCVGGSSYTSYLNLPFSFFNNIKNAIPVSFVEPIKIRVYFSDLKFGSKATNTALTHTVSDPALLCEFRVLDNEDEDATIQENYDSVLTQLNYDYETEGAVVGTLTTSDLVMEKTLTSNAVASDIYIIVSADTSQQSASTDALQKALEAPLLLRKVQFEGSGQNILPEVSAEYLEFYGRRSGGDGFHSSGTAPHTQGADDPCALRWVYKLQLAMTGDKQQQSGGVSLREINAPKIKITVAGALATDNLTGDGADTENPNTSAVDNGNESILASAKVSMRVVVRHHTLVSTDPSSGRLTNMLTN